jgi:hypothetical protein
MSKRPRLSALALLLSLASVAAWAQQIELPRPPARTDAAPDLPRAPPAYVPDTSPTHNACTTEKLLRDEACSFEFLAPAVSGEAVTFDNQKRAAKLAAGCPNAATAPGELKPDPALLKQCEADIAENAVTSCGLGGTAALQDEQGRWSTVSRDCAAALQGALAKTRTQAVVSVRCCRCLAAARCPVAGPACLSQLHSNLPSAELSACVQRSGCAETCSVLRDFQQAPAPAPKREPDHNKKKATDASFQTLYF